MPDIARNYVGRARRPMDKFLATLDFNHLVDFLRVFKCSGDEGCHNCSAFTQNNYVSHLKEAPGPRPTVLAFERQCLFTLCLNRAVKNNSSCLYFRHIRLPASSRIIVAGASYYFPVRDDYSYLSIHKSHLKLFLRQSFNVSSFLFDFLPMWDNVKFSRHAGERL